MKKILIVDDIRTYIDQEKGILGRADFRIFTATSGEEALKIHKAEKVDLIIADLNMPGIGGDKLCSLIRNDEELKQVSFIIVCAGGKSDMERYSRCKANSYITKPVTPAGLLEKVGQLLDIPERKSYRVLLKVTVTGKSLNDSFFCSSQNISTSGLLIETERALEKGDKISCSFFLPNAERIVADAEVVRIVRKSNHTLQYGVRYVNIGPSYKAAIEGFVNKRAGKKAP